MSFLSLWLSISLRLSLYVLSHLLSLSPFPPPPPTSFLSLPFGSAQNWCVCTEENIRTSVKSDRSFNRAICSFYSRREKWSFNMSNTIKQNEVSVINSDFPYRQGVKRKIDEDFPQIESGPVIEWFKIQLLFYVFKVFDR